jgi:hypothetical protein
MPVRAQTNPSSTPNFAYTDLGEGAVSIDRPYHASHRVLLSLTDAVEKVFSGKRMTFFFAAEAPRV